MHPINRHAARTFHIRTLYSAVFDDIPALRESRSSIEIYFNTSLIDGITDADIARLRSLLDWGPSISLHSPFMDLSPGGVDTKVVDATMYRFRQVIGFARVLDPVSIVFHSGWDSPKFEGNVDLWLRNSVRTWRAVLEESSSLRARILVENVFEDSPEGIRRLAEGVGSERFGVCLDVGHLNIHSDRGIGEWVGALGEFVREVHLHDNNGEHDDHLPPGKGGMDFGAVLAELAKLEHNLILTFELKDLNSAFESAEAMSLLV